MAFAEYPHKQCEIACGKLDCEPDDLILVPSLGDNMGVHGIKTFSAAVADVKFHNLSIRKAAEKYKVPKSSRSDRITGKIPECASWTLGEIVLSPNFHDQPTKIWNMDETRISLAPKPTKVIAKKGIKTLHGKTSSFRELITVIACANAGVGFLPPRFVFPGKTKRKLESYDFEVATTPTSPIRGANVSVSDSGWTKDGFARLWFTNTFLKNIGPSRPQLLICDGHGSHNNVEFLELAKENDIIVVELPSHTSQWTQPLDRSVFKSLKCHWNTTVDNFIRETGVSVGGTSHHGGVP
ncbi:uncharacterized protein [Magallana gigas]|uniref:uncharacterized protein n=1 Tax=Magallana gigas TaxID=29159 RepID=UPI00333F205E